MRIRWTRQSFRWAAVFAWMGLIFYLSAQSTLPDLTGGRPDLQDIAGHFAAYAVLALLWRWALLGMGVRHASWWALALTLLYALSDEFHQRFVPNRNPDLFDVATDAGGAALALWAAAAWQRWRAPSARGAAQHPSRP